MSEPIKTGMKFCGLNILIDSTGIAEVDKAIKTMYYDSSRRTAPLGIIRKDVQLVMAWLRGKVEKKPEPQGLLFEG